MSDDWVKFPKTDKRVVKGVLTSTDIGKKQNKIVSVGHLFGTRKYVFLNRTAFQVLGRPRHSQQTNTYADSQVD